MKSAIDAWDNQYMQEIQKAVCNSCGTTIEAKSSYTVQPIQLNAVASLDSMIKPSS
jgi:hypothetical protein